MATPKLLLCGSFLPPQTNFALNLAASYQAFPLLTLGVGPAAQLITCTFLVALVDFAQQRGGLEIASADVIGERVKRPTHCLGDRLLDVWVNLACYGVQVFAEKRAAFSLGVLLAEQDIFAGMAIADSPDAYHILIGSYRTPSRPSLPVGPVMSAEAMAMAPPPTAAITLFLSFGVIAIEPILAFFPPVVPVHPTGGNGAGDTDNNCPVTQGHPAILSAKIHTSALTAPAYAFAETPQPVSAVPVPYESLL